MANGVYHTGHDIVIDLTRPDLGHPDRPGLWEEIYGERAQRNPRMLQCLANRQGGACHSETASKSPWMYIRVQTVGGVRTPVAVHRNHGEHAEPAAESDQRKAPNERICRNAQAAGFAADIEPRAVEASNLRTDAGATGEGGIHISREPHMPPLGSGAVRRRRRSGLAAQDSLTRQEAPVDGTEPAPATAARLRETDRAGGGADHTGGGAPKEAGSVLVLPSQVLDWRDGEHWNPVPDRCVHCGRLCSLFDETGLPMHKVCAETVRNRP